MGLIKDVQTMWNIGEKLKKCGFKETLCVEFFGPLTHEEKQKAWDWHKQGMGIEDISDELNKEPWLVFGFVSTKEYHIQQPDPGKRLADIPTERGQELALKVVQKAREIFLEDNYKEESLENIEKVLAVIEDSNYNPDKWDYMLLQRYEYRMHIARRMLKKMNLSDTEICDITDLQQEDLNKIKNSLFII